MKKYFYSLCFLLLFLMGTHASFSQTCPCTIPAGITGFANCIEVSTTTDPNITNASGACGSLRWAILKANTLTGGTYIKFNIPGTAPFVITLNGANALPSVTSKVYIDASSQPGYSTVTKEPLITIQSNSNVGNGITLIAGTSGSTIQGLRIRNFKYGGILVANNAINNAALCISNINIFDNVVYNIINSESMFTYGISFGYLSSGCVGSGSLIYGNIIGSDKVNNTITPAGAMMNSCVVIFNGANTTTDQAIAVTNIQIGNISLNKSNYFSNWGSEAIWLINGSTNMAYLNQVLISGNLFINNVANYFEIILNHGSPLGSTYSNNNKAAPFISKVLLSSMSGTALPNDKVEVYRSNTTIRNVFLYIGTAVADASGNWTLDRSQWVDPLLTTTASDVYKATATDQQNNTSPFSATLCGYVSMSTLPAFFCPNAPSVTLSGIPSGGNFTGSGISGNVFSPTSAASGVNTLAYTVSAPAGCVNSASQKVLVIAPPVNKDRVISATANTFSDAWPLDFNSTMQKQECNQNELVNGSKGIWKLEESYIYTKYRKQSVPIQIWKDGLMDTVPMYNWESSMNGGCSPAWRKTNTVTRYSPYSFELENKDILDVYAAALYGYNGDFPVAVASNSKANEIAFEGFEEYTASGGVTSSNLSTGNLTFYTTAPATYTTPFFKQFEIEVATDNVLTVVFPYANAAELQGKTIEVFGSDMNHFNNKDVYGNYSITSIAQGADASRIKVTLNSATFLHTGIWQGKVSVPYPVGTFPVANINGKLSISEFKHHTGKNSLKATGNADIEQVSLCLKAGDTYVISMWISADYTDRYTFRSPVGEVNKRGVIIQFLNLAGTEISNTGIIEPAAEGVVIEGWQKIEKEFLVPVGTRRVVLKFSAPATEATYFDDLRIFPFNGNIQTYVYNPVNLKLSAVLDNNNYASLYYYDEQGNLYLTKKETERGIMTAQEVLSHQKE